MVDSGTTLTVIQLSDAKYVTDTNQPSNKIFQVATGEQTRGGNVAKLHNGLRGGASEADLVPTLQKNSLISMSKLADENYHTLFTPTEVLIYDGSVDATKTPVWKGWRDPSNGLWRIPLRTKTQTHKSYRRSRYKTFLYKTKNAFVQQMTYQARLMQSDTCTHPLAFQQNPQYCEQHVWDF